MRTLIGSPLLCYVRIFVVILALSASAIGVSLDEDKKSDNSGVSEEKWKLSTSDRSIMDLVLQDFVGYKDFTYESMVPNAINKHQIILGNRTPGSFNIKFLEADLGREKDKFLDPDMREDLRQKNINPHVLPDNYRPKIPRILVENLRQLEESGNWTADFTKTYPNARGFSGSMDAWLLEKWAESNLKSSIWPHVSWRIWNLCYGVGGRSMGN